MRNDITVFLSGITLILATDLWLFLLLRKWLHNRLVRAAYWAHTSLFLCGLVFYRFSVSSIQNAGSYYWFGLGIGLLFLFYAPKLLFVILDSLSLLASRVCKRMRQWGRTAATVIALSSFLLFLYGITIGRSQYKIERADVTFSTLPPSFDNLRIVQLSDMHLGSLSTGFGGIAKMVCEVNTLHPDVILFTGDMVNNFASEISPWTETLLGLQAPLGKFAIMGNHDYGNYTQWNSAADKQQNREDFLRNMASSGFKMLNNDHALITRGGDTLCIAGVENWGRPPFPQYGDLNRATEGCDGWFTILLSHDPSHWRAEALPRGIPLTLSGHTHAMQLGLKIGHWEWSPSKYLYPEYDGLYEHDGHYLYVSRGEGYVGFPGRVGLRPVISLITCHTAKEK